jgi:hypothetical protein
MACKQAAMSWIFNGAGFSEITYADGNVQNNSLKTITPSHGFSN